MDGENSTNGTPHRGEPAEPERWAAWEKESIGHFVQAMHLDWPEQGTRVD